MTEVSNRETFLLRLKSLLPKDSVGVELGVFQGDFSKQILDIINPKHLILIDPFEVGGKVYEDGLSSAYSSQEDYAIVCEKFEKELNNILEAKVMLRKGYSYEVVKNYPNNSIDFIYHDASHLYFDIKRDLNDWLPKLKDNGIMCGHDYIGLYGFGVKQAVDEFCKEHNFEMVILNHNGGDFALRKISE